MKMWYYIQVHFKRGVAQLVERVVWDHEVARSIRVTPTKQNRITKTDNSVLFLYDIKQKAGKRGFY